MAQRGIPVITTFKYEERLAYFMAKFHIAYHRKSLDQLTEYWQKALWVLKLSSAESYERQDGNA